LALFIIFSTAAEKLNNGSGKIEVRTRTSPDDGGVEILVTTCRSVSEGIARQSPVDDASSSEMALRSAMQLLASIGGNLRLEGDARACVLHVPKRSAAKPTVHSPMIGAEQVRM
jgi:hypothetical protein